MAVLVSDGRAAKAKRKSVVTKLFRLWRDETDGPDFDSVPDEVHEVIESWVSELPYDEVAYLVRSAARLKQSQSDDEDTKRLVRVLTDENSEHQATSAYEAGKPVIVYQKPKLRMFRDELEDLLEIDYELEPVEEEAAALILRTMTLEQATTLREQIEDARAGEFPMTPSEFIEFKRTRKWRSATGKTKKRPAHRATDSYEGGARESSSFAKIDMAVDLEAKKLYLQGASPDRVRRLHDAAPAGYWAAVGTMVDQGTTVKAAYAALEEEWKWHPRMRKR